METAKQCHCPIATRVAETIYAQNCKDVAICFHFQICFVTLCFALPSRAFSALMTFFLLSQHMLYCSHKLIFYMKNINFSNANKDAVNGSSTTFIVSSLLHFRQHFNLLVLTMCAEAFVTFPLWKYEMLHKSLKCTYSNFRVVKSNKRSLSHLSKMNQ